MRRKSRRLFHLHISADTQTPLHAVKLYPHRFMLSPVRHARHADEENTECWEDYPTETLLLVRHERSPIAGTRAGPNGVRLQKSRSTIREM